MSCDRNDCNAVVAAAEQFKISKVALADRYIPTIARTLGELWVSDHIGFAEVTIGSARLQAMLRDLGPEWSADTMAQPDAPSILLLTPENASHTLGAVVLAGQLRRNGFSVRITFDANRQSVANIMDRISFDAVFLSAAHSENLEKVRRMIEFVRTLTHKELPIVLGGTMIEAAKDVAALTGANIATSNLDEAIEYCGLITTLNKSATSAVGTKTMGKLRQRAQPR